MATPTILSPELGEGAKPARARRAGRVIALSTLLAAAAVLLFAFTARNTERSDVSFLSLVAVATGFGLSQLSIVRVGGRSDAEDIEFSSVLLLVAVFLVPARELIIAAVIGTLVLNLMARRGWLKVIYNTAHRAMSVSVFVFVASKAVPDPRAVGVSESIVLFLSGVFLFGFIEPLLVSIVLFLYRGNAIKPLHTTMMMVAVCHTAVGLLAANAWVQVQSGAPLAILAAGVYVIAVYAFAKVEQRASRAETLQTFIRAVDSTLSREQMLMSSVPQIAGALRANTAHLYVFSRDGETGADAWTRGALTAIEPLRLRSNEVWPYGELTPRVVTRTESAGRFASWLDNFDAQEAVIVPMFDGEAISGAVVVADRPENDRRFDEQDKDVLMAIASHLAISIERQRLLDRLQHGSLHDALTDLPNRRLFHQRLEQCVFRSRSNGEPFALVMADLDGFKAVNDSFGHHVGDELLRRIAIRLRELIRPEDTVARLGGDEFAVVLPAATESDAQAIAERLRTLLGVTMVVDGHEIAVGASVGVAAWSEADHAGEDVLRRADAAMYADKSARRVDDRSA